MLHSLPGCHMDPGHPKDESTDSNGFCIFNNVAIGALYAAKCGFQRIAVIDFGEWALAPESSHPLTNIPHRTC